MVSFEEFLDLYNKYDNIKHIQPQKVIVNTINSTYNFNTCYNLYLKSGIMYILPKTICLSTIPIVTK